MTSVVFQESVRAAPSHIYARGSSAPKEPLEIPLEIPPRRFLCTIYVCRGGANPPIAPAYSGHYAVVSCSPKFFILDLREHQEPAWTDLSPTQGLRYFLRPQLLPVAGLLSQWFLPPPGGVSVETCKINKSSAKMYNPAKGYTGIENSPHI